MSNNKIFILLLILVSLSQAYGQTDLTFLHAGKNVPQVNSLQPASFPDARFYTSFPGLPSGIRLGVRGEVTADDIFHSDSVSATGENVVYINELISDLAGDDAISLDLSFNIFQAGFRLKDYGAVSLFANERMTAYANVPLEVADFVLHDVDNLGQRLSTGDFGVNVDYFREYGVGYTHSLDVWNGKKLRVGARFKYLQGLVHVESSPNANVQLYTDSVSLVKELSIRDMTLNTAGVEALDNEEYEYLISNSNTGFGVDIGAEMDINDKLTVGFALNDLGRIFWKDYVKNYSIEDGSILLQGTSLEDADGALDALEDSLDAFTQDETNFNSYARPIPSRLLLDASYSVIKKGRVRASTLFYMDENNHHQTYALGYIQTVGKMLDVSATLSYQSDFGMSVGGGFAARLGILQIYTSVENIPQYLSSTGLSNNDHINVRFGMNLLFGRTLKKQKKQKSTVQKLPKQKTKEVKPEEESIGPFPDKYQLDHLLDPR